MVDGNVRPQRYAEKDYMWSAYEKRLFLNVMLIICIILIWMVLKANRGYHEFLLYTPNLLSVAMVQSLSLGTIVR